MDLFFNVLTKIVEHNLFHSILSTRGVHSFVAVSSRKISGEQAAKILRFAKTTNLHYDM